METRQVPPKLYFHDRILAATILRLIPLWVRPNQITIFRFLFTPVVFFLLYKGYLVWGFWAFLLAAFSDALDGSLARTRDQVTAWGKVYDPLADKILIASVIYVIVLQTIGFWTSVIIIGLEVIIIIAAWVRKIEGRVIQANWWGKIKMILQVLGVSVLLLAIIFNWTPLLFFASGALYLAIVFAVISLLTHGV
jgi:CDP-diacylglycerol--glycerol-3-phosphate 3-phosphatidyltransferase